MGGYGYYGFNAVTPPPMTPNRQYSATLLNAYARSVKAGNIGIAKNLLSAYKSPFTHQAYTHGAHHPLGGKDRLTQSAPPSFKSLSGAGKVSDIISDILVSSFRFSTCVF